MEANRLLTMAEEMAHVGHWQFDQITGQGYFSDEARRITGLELGGPPPTREAVLAAYHVEDRERVMGLLAAHVAAGTRFEYSARVVRPNGDVRAVLVRGRCDRDTAANAIVTFGTVLDVTEIRRTEEQLRDTSALLTTTLNTMDQGLLMIDGHGIVVVANRRAAELLDLDPAFLARRPHYTEVRQVQSEAGEYAATDPAFQAWVGSAALAAPIPVYERVRPNGTVLEVRSAALADGGVLRTYTDITERRRAEAALQAKTALLDATLEHMDQGLMMVDAGGAVQVCNARACELLALPPAMMQARPAFDDVLRYQQVHDDFRKSDDSLRQWVAGGGMEARAHTYERERPNGTVLEIRTVPLSDGSAVRTYTDITERKKAEQRLQALTDTLPQMVWVASGEDGATVYANQRFRDTFGEGGRTRAERVAAHHPDDQARAAREGDEARLHGQVFATEARWPGPDGAQRWHKIVLAPVGRGAEAPEWLGTALDIEDIVAAREALRTSEERLSLTLDASNDGLWDRDLVTDAAWYSDRAQTMLGYAPGEFAVRSLRWEHLVHPEDRERALRLRADHIAGRTAAYECEHRLRSKAGGYTWVLSRGKVVARDAAGQALRMVGTHIDIDARKAAEARIAHMARHDALTDLPNRTLFHERLEEGLAEIGSREGGLAVLCLDLDRFKAVNDTLGHQAGDTLLREVAARLRSTLRSEDTVARLGGDEFAILLGGSPRGEVIRDLAARLIAAVQLPMVLGEQQVEVGLSLGIARAPEHGQDSETVFRHADLALYQAKAQGRGRFCVFEASMDAAAAERSTLERDLRRAIHNGDLALHYQPQVNTETSEIVGFEALVRWTHPSRGPVSPASFVALAEETGLIVPLGEWVLRAACREAASWARPLKVAVNLSPRQFAQHDLPKRVLAILADTGLSPTRLELEITETVIINDVDHARSILRQLKALGITIAMDDFGTGYSSLASLQAFPFDKIKIDRAFVGSMKENPQAAAIVRAVLGLGRSLEMGVVAEGVETEAQLRFLADASCDEVQGYLMGRPQPIDAFAEIVRVARPAERGRPKTSSEKDRRRG